MRHLILTAIFAAYALSTAACDDSTVFTSSAAPVGTGGSGSTDTGTANSSQSAPLNTAQQAPLNTAQQAPLNTEQQMPSVNVAIGTCVSGCEHYLALGCSSADAPSDCTAYCNETVPEIPSQCLSLFGTYINCVTTSCDAACETQTNAWEHCVNLGDSSTPDDTSSPGTNTPSISNSACYSSNQCLGCTSECDICICTLQLAGSTSSSIATGCATYCTSG
jgi:hypothetical protein